MSSAWRNHKPEDSNADITTLARLGTIVETTRVAVAHALNVSGEAISIRTPWRPAEAFDPNPYTALSDFHHKVMTSAHPDSPHARRPLQPGSAAGRASHTLSTPSSGRPDHVTRAVTSRQERKATVHHTVQMRPNPTYVTKSAAAETIDQQRPEATPTFIRLSRRPFLAMGRGSPAPQVRQGTIGCLQDEVVLKRSTHAPKEAWHATIANGWLITIGGQNTGEHLSSKRPARLEQPPLRRVPLKNRCTTSGASSTAPPTASVYPRNHPRAKLAKSKPEVNPGSQIKAANTRLDVQLHGMQLDWPHTFWKCAFCPEERSTLLESHIGESHEGQLFRFECGKCNFQAEGPRLLRKHQVEAHKTDIVWTAKPAAAKQNTDMADQAERPQEPSLHEDPVKCSDEEVNLSSNSDESVSDGNHEEATVTIQKIGKLNFPPLNPENQSRGDPNNNAKLAAAPSFRKALKKAPGRIRPGAILLGAASATQACNTPKEIVVLEVEDMPIELGDDIYHVICPTCYDIVQKIRYALHKSRKSCNLPASPLEDT